ncbi:SCO family protein [bacterium]|nr:SCO family protein [bacterium]
MAVHLGVRGSARYLGLWAAVLLAGLAGGVVSRAAPPAGVGLDEQLGQIVPLNLEFRDESNQVVTLQSLVTKPTLLTLVYYECPSICSPLLNGLVDTLQRVDLEPGRDYNVLTISFDETETADLARRKRDNYLSSFKRPIAPESWRFLVGDEAAIKALTDAVGFRFQRKGRDFNHVGSIIVLGADGKIIRYLQGITFLPFDIQMAVVEASKGRTMPTVSRVLAFCYSYDPVGRKYAFNILKVFGLLTMVFLVLFVAFVLITTRLYRKKEVLARGHTSAGDVTGRS